VFATDDSSRETRLFAVDGGQPRPVLGLRRGEAAHAWSADGRAVYVSSTSIPLQVSLLDVSTGRRRLWKELQPAEVAGVAQFMVVLPTPDGSGYAYSFRRLLDDLYLVEGLE